MIGRNKVGLGHRLAGAGDQIISEWNQQMKRKREKIHIKADQNSKTNDSFRH
jgi:hypothetical protein